MLITPVNTNFNYIPKRTSFRAREPYYDEEFVKKMVEKYKFLKFYDNALFNDLSEHFPDDGLMLIFHMNCIDMDIAEFRETYDKNKEKVENFDKEMDQKGKTIKAVDNKNKSIENKICDLEVKRELELIKTQKSYTSEQRISKICNELNKNYVQLNNMKDTFYPNGIMLIGANDKEVNEVLNYLLDQKCKLFVTDFNSYPVEQAVKKLFSLKKEALNQDKHCLVVIKNFLKYTTQLEENDDFIHKLKAFLSAARSSNFTVLAVVSAQEKMDNIVNQGHRFEIKIDVADIELDVETKFIPNRNGYTLQYGKEQSEVVDIQLGAKGRDKRVLWVDTQDPIKIVKVLQRIDKIKKLDEFKKIKYIQSLQPTSLNILKDFELVRKNSDGVGIYEMKI